MIGRKWRISRSGKQAKRRKRHVATPTCICWIAFLAASAEANSANPKPMESALPFFAGRIFTSTLRRPPALEKCFLSDASVVLKAKFLTNTECVCGLEMHVG